MEHDDLTVDPKVPLIRRLESDRELLLRICERAECHDVLLSHGGVRVGLGLELLARP